MASPEMEIKRLYIKAALGTLVLSIFGILLVLIFFVEIPSAMETLTATMLGGLISTVHGVISHFFDSTDAEERRLNGHSNGKIH
jgi:hypothetical protein